ncbi:MAG: D-aminoacylase [Acidobacteriota bacterium]|nr:D-aminoacylase [Acidobacteriota bacterium]
MKPGRLTIAFLLAVGAASLPGQDFDLVVAGGRVVDGMGNPWYRADIGIRDGRIAEIGKLAGRTARRTIHIHGQVVSPGFIDMMGASSLPLLDDPASAESKLRQGITTLLAGEGMSQAPQNERTSRSPGELRWRTFGEYFALLERKGIPMNAIHDVGAAQVRLAVIGDKNQVPSPAQMVEMKKLVGQAMRDGAVGLSTALIYPPGTYAKTEELVEMAKVVGEYGGVYMSHMRNESNRVLDAIRETIHIGEAAGIPSHVFHLKAAGEENWPLIKDAIALIESARRRGLDVTADIYPYVRNGIGLSSFINPSHFSDGAKPFLKTLSDAKVRANLRREIETTSNWENWYRHVGKNWDNVLVASVASVGSGIDKSYEGKSIAQIAVMRKEDEWNTFFDLVRAGEVNVNPKSMDEEQKRIALRTPWVSVCTDSEPLNIRTATNAHPRAFGSFVRVLAKYVRDEKVITLEQAVRQMSSLPSNFLQLYDRGRIAPGMAADLLVFDPEKVQDTATFEKPLSFPTGMPYVIVNGKVEIDDGRFTGEKGGMVLRHRGL